MKDVRGKVFLVTGGAMGMGKLVAEHFARDGAKVVIWDVNEEALEETVAEFRDRGWEVHPYIVDVTDREKVYEVADRVRDEVGTVDVVMNNAGVVKGGAFLDVDDEWHRKTMDVNFNAYLWLTRAFLPDMMARNDGHFINVASAAGLTNVALMTTYAASKAAVLHFTDSLRVEMKILGKRGVKFTAICPSYVKTGMFEGVKEPRLVPWLEPEEITEKIYRAYHKNRPLVREPFQVKLVALYRAVLTRSTWDLVSRLLGIAQSMDAWRGR